MSDMLEKWGKPVAERGFAQVPNYLMLLNQFLDDEHRLGPLELLVLLQLVGTWWKKGDKPFPSMATLARRCGSSERQMQRAVNQLVALGLIAKEKRRVGRGLISSNAYDLTPLTKVLEEAAKVYPNDYPRKVDPAATRRITDLFGKGAPSAAQATAVTGDEEVKQQPPSAEILHAKKPA